MAREVTTTGSKQYRIIIMMVSMTTVRDIESHSTIFVSRSIIIFAPVFRRHLESPCGWKKSRDLYSKQYETVPVSTCA